jgi:predicted enzyme related to lactoylglutathione lyase
MASTADTSDYDGETRSASGQERVFRAAGISYLHIPAPDPSRSAAFYRAVFGWELGGAADEPSFQDGTGHVIGHFMRDLAVAGDAGPQPYIYVESIDDTLDKLSAHGADLVREPYPEGDLWVATFHDPGGNVVGVWQRGPRR